VRHELRQLDDAASVARVGAALLADVISGALASSQRCAVALSGGKTPRAMFPLLAAQPVEWDRVDVFQVDERVAPDGDVERNATHIAAAFAATDVRLHLMGVNEPDLDAACASYAASLPERFDAVHLGIGADGHTASLVPGDPVLTVTDRLVAATLPYQDHRRMTLTYPALSRADVLVWLVAGADKADALGRLIAGDPSIPAGNVDAPISAVLADAASAAGLT